MNRNNIAGPAISLSIIILIVLLLSLMALSCGDTLILQGDNPGVISTIAGGGDDVAEHGDAALDVTIVQPKQIIARDLGDFYILESGFHRLLYVDSRGKVNRIAGSTNYGFSGDGGPAVNALLYDPAGISIDNSGNLYIADMSNHRVRKIDTAGIISTVAGSEIAGFGGDGGPATEASLYKPVDVTVDPMGRLFISDNGNNRIRMVDLDGTIQTVCGTGDYQFNGNGIPAVDANVFRPIGVDADDQGNIYIAVSGHHMIRKIDNSGIISTVAGSGVPGFSGDGSSAVSASLNSPHDVFAVAGGEGFYIADHDNHRIRFVDMNSSIFTVAGNGDAGYNGDGLYAIEASLNGPAGVSADFFGNLYIADTNNFRVRRVPFPEAVAEDSGPEAPHNPLAPELL